MKNIKKAKISTALIIAIAMLLTLAPVYTNAATYKPVKVKSLTVSKVANTENKVKLVYTKQSKATGYQIYQKIGTASYKKIKTITSAKTNTYTCTQKFNTVYSYKVRAYKKTKSKIYTGTYSPVKTINLKKVVEDKPTIVIPEPTKEQIESAEKRIITCGQYTNGSLSLYGHLNFYKKDIGKTFDVTELTWQAYNKNTKYYEGVIENHKLLKGAYKSDQYTYDENFIDCFDIFYKEGRTYIKIKKLGYNYLEAGTSKGKDISLGINVVEDQDSSIYFDYKGTDGSKDIRIALGDDFNAISSQIGKEDFICDRRGYKVYVYDTNAPTVTSPVMYQDQAYLNTLTAAEKNKRSNTGAVIPNSDKNKWNKGDFSNFLMLYVLDGDIIGWWTNQQSGNFVVADGVEYKHNATNVPFESVATDNVKTVYKSRYITVTIARMCGTNGQGGGPVIDAGNKCAAGGVLAKPSNIENFSGTTELEMFWEERLCDAWSNGIRKGNTAVNAAIGEFSEIVYGYKYGTKEIAQDQADTSFEWRNIPQNGHRTAGQRYSHLGTLQSPFDALNNAELVINCWGAENKVCAAGENQILGIKSGEDSAIMWYKSNGHAQQLDGRNDILAMKDTNKISALLISAFSRGIKPGVANNGGAGIMQGGYTYKKMPI
ncbi:MAG: hypothetical protein ACRCUS_07855 [Anaerovoracaceae bacterium]